MCIRKPQYKQEKIKHAFHSPNTLLELLFRALYVKYSRTPLPNPIKFESKTELICLKILSLGEDIWRHEYITSLRPRVPNYHTQHQRTKDSQPGDC